MGCDDDMNRDSWKGHFDSVQDSGKCESFPSGAVRDTQDGKPRYDLLPVAALRRVAQHYANGAKKYGDRNWEKGIPIDRCYASAFRHLIQWRENDKSEDHLSAVVFNILAIIHFEETRGEVGQEEGQWELPPKWLR